MHNLVDKRQFTTSALWYGKILKFCSIFTWESFFLEHFILNKIILQKFGKLKIFCLKLYLQYFISKVTSAKKVLQVLVFKFRENNYWLELVVKFKLVSVVCHIISSLTGHLKLFLQEAVYSIVLTFTPLSST